MGRVDLAVRRDGSFLRLYAVKRLHAHLREDVDVRVMFLDEARIAGLLRHPNVVSVVDVGEDDEGPFLVMEYVEGVTVGTLIEKSVAAGELVPLGVALRIGLHAARGLHAAHDLAGPDGAPLSLVHRDVSPYNVLVGFDGVTRVTDFGIAKALGRLSGTSTGILKGKLGYMSPEQLQFRGQDRRSDLFSLGVVLFELLTSSRLYPGTLAEESARRILDEPPPDLLDFRDDAPPELVALLFELLAKDPANRPGDAREVARTLEATLHDLAAAGEDADVGAYLEAQFGEERRALTRDIAAALTADDARPLPRVPGLLRRWAVPAAVLVFAATAVGAWTAGRAGGEPPAAASAPRPEASVTAAPAPPAPRNDESAPPAPPAHVEKRAAARPAAPREPARSEERARPRSAPGGEVRIWNWQ